METFEAQNIVGDTQIHLYEPHTIASNNMSKKVH